VGTPRHPPGGASKRQQHRRELSPRSRRGRPLLLDLSLLLRLGLPELLIDCNRYAEDCVYDPRQEALHRRKELILQPGDLFLPIGVINPAAPQGLITPVALQKPKYARWHDSSQNKS